MTNQEAIELIKVAQAEVEWSCPMDYAAAFDLAIKSLEAWEKVKAEIEQLPTDYCGGYIGLDKREILRIIDKYKKGVSE